MKITTLVAAVAICLGMAAAANAGTTCGANTGKAATGAPVKVGGIYGNAAPGDFSSSTTAAKAYFDCVNANGGLNGRPIEYLTENDQWNPELAAQAALLRYLAVAHFGRGRGDWAQGESPPHWREVVQRSLAAQREALAAVQDYLAKLE